MSEQDENVGTKAAKDMSAYERWELPNLQEGVVPKKSFSTRQEVKPLTAEDIEKIRAEAYQDGLKQGHTEGLNKGVIEGRKKGLQIGREEGLKLGRVDAEKELIANKQSLETLCKSLLSPIEEQHDELEQVLLNTTLALVRAVIHTETRQNSELIKAAVSKCLESLPKSASGISIQLHPDDYSIVTPIISQMAPDARLSPNSALVRGGCVVETNQQVLDYTIEKRFQLAVQRMLLDVAEKGDFEAHQESPKTLQSHTDYPSEVLEQGAKEREEQNELNALKEQASLLKADSEGSESAEEVPISAEIESDGSESKSAKPSQSSKADSDSKGE